MPRFLLAFLILISPFLVVEAIAIASRPAPVATAHVVPQLSSATVLPSIAPTVIPSSTPTPEPSTLAVESPSSATVVLGTSKKSYRIAVIGDSMVETMGGNLEYILAQLKQKYPGVKFDMYNYGQGSENVVQGAERFDKPYSLGDRKYPSLAEVHPDILIVGSWAYNPLVEGDKATHWNTLSTIVNKAKSVAAKVYVLSEIAPLENGFGTGVGGVNWPENIVKPHIAKIVEYMQNVKGLAFALGVEHIDAYAKSTTSGGVYGQAQYVSTHDRIHPSVAGHTFMAKTIAETIKLD